MTSLQNLKVFTWNAAFSFSFPLPFLAYLQQEIQHRFSLADVHSSINVVRYTSVGFASFCGYRLYWGCWGLMYVSMISVHCALCMCNVPCKRQVHLCYNTSVAVDGFPLSAVFPLTILHKDWKMAKKETRQGLYFVHYALKKHIMVIVLRNKKYQLGLLPIVTNWNIFLCLLENIFYAELYSRQM